MKSKTLIALICLSIPLEGAGSSLVNAGTIEALREGDGAVRCTADATVTVNGGTVLSIACAGGTAVQNEDRQEAVQYALLQCGRQAAAARAARHPVTHRTSGRGARKCAQAARRIRRRSTIASISRGARANFLKKVLSEIRHIPYNNDQRNLAICLR